MVREVFRAESRAGLIWKYPNLIIFKILNILLPVFVLCYKLYNVIAFWNWYKIADILLEFKSKSFNLRLNEKSLKKFKDTVINLKKVPNHIGILITPEESNSLDTIKYLSRNISWIYLAGINNISVYSVQEFQYPSSKLSKLIYHEISNIIQMNSQANDNTRKEILQLPEIRINICGNNVQFQKKSEPSSKEQNKESLNINIFSYMNSKAGFSNIIMEALIQNTMRNETPNTKSVLVKDQVRTMDKKSNDYFDKYFEMVSSAKNSTKNRKIPNEMQFNNFINEQLYKNSIVQYFEPDVIIIHGDIHTVFGYLPWHIRLTEFYWTNADLKNFGINQLLQILITFSQVNQKLGK